MDVGEDVDDFLERVRQLGIQRQQEDELRRKKLEEDMNNISIDDNNFTISLPNPVARKIETIPNSESLRNFNKQISKEYRLNIDELVYESAYNYEKSLRGDTPKTSRSDAYQKYDKIPEIIRFDDTMKNSSATTSRYAKFQLSEEEKRSLDKKINSLIGDEDLKADEGEYIPQPLVKEKKGGKLSLFEEKQWSSVAGTKPRLAPAAKISTGNSSYYSQPGVSSPQFPARTMSLETQTRADDFSKPASPLKKSPGKLHMSKYIEDNHKTVQKPQPPAIKPKPTFTEYEDSDVAPPLPARKPHLSNFSSKERPGLTARTRSSSKEDTDESKAPPSLPSRKHGWLDSAIKHSSSTPQGTDTTSRLVLGASEDRNAWLTSAIKNTPHKEFEQIQSKIKPIVPSKSNTLTRKLKEEKDERDKEEAKRKELEDLKLKHIKDVLEKKEARKEEPFSPIVLKKNRSSVPAKVLEERQTTPEFLEQKLTPKKTSNTRKISAKEVEAFAAKAKLKPKPQVRKPSTEIPEALRKAEKLKPALPPRKPSIKIPEAVIKKGQLKQATHIKNEEEPLPEGLSRKRELKPVVSQRKHSVKELEALEQLNKIKNKKKVAPTVNPKPRVLSNSLEVLQNQLNGLKSRKQDTTTSKQEKQENIERILKRVQTDSSLPSPVRLPIVPSDSVYPGEKIRKAATFDSSQLEKPVKLDHITKSRTKGPKRRAPKGIK